MKIIIGSDHAGFEMKQKLIPYLKQLEYEVVDKGTHSEESVNYPDFGHTVAKSVLKTKNSLGILLCGSGNGVCMTANKHHGIRAALAWNTEIAELARKHNDANVLCIPARFMSLAKIKEMVSAFLSTNFEGGRHKIRVDLI